jgi:hypothetical protein
MTGTETASAYTVAGFKSPNAMFLGGRVEILAIPSIIALNLA